MCLLVAVVLLVSLPPPVGVRLIVRYVLGIFVGGRDKSLVFVFCTIVRTTVC